MALELKNLNISYEKHIVLKDINFKIDSNRCFIVGPNACGKSSLLKSISGELAYIGSILRPQNCYYIPSKFDILENLYLKDLLYIFDLEKKIFYNSLVYKLLNLEEIKNFGCLQMSSGQLQRLFIALHIVKLPDLLLLDEPLNFLEWKYRYNMAELIKKYPEDKQILCVTHDLDWLLHFPKSQLLCLKNQSILHQGQVESVLISEDFQKAFDFSTKILDNPISGQKKILITTKRYET